MRLSSGAAALIVAAGAGLVTAQPKESQGRYLGSDLSYPDLETATDLVFVADGYRPSEEMAFLEAAREAVRDLRADPAAQPLLAGKRVNFHYVFAPSSGPVPARSSVPGDTACRSYVADHVLKTGDPARAEALADSAPDKDGVIVFARLDRGGSNILANADARGGRVRMHDRDTGTLLHELGHALLGVGDEYEGDDAPDAAARELIAQLPNLSLDRTGARWAAIANGVREGGGGYDHDVYRAERSCRMRACRSGELCRVCLAQLGARAPGRAPVLVANLTAEGHVLAKELGSLDEGSYEVRVRAFGASGDSPWSAAHRFTIARPPTAARSATRGFIGRLDER